MVFPLDENLDPTPEEIYDELYLYDEDDPDGEGYFIKNTKRCFPSLLSEVEMFQVLIRVLAWAVARSYQQPTILKYIYDPDLVLDVLLPKLADTLEFKLPIDYPKEEVRMVIKYLQKIRRTRGTFNAVKKLVRILNISRREILEMNWDDYGSVGIQNGDKGVVFVQYNNINDLDFLIHMLSYVMPAGYRYYVESGLETRNVKGNVYRNRLELSYSRDCIGNIKRYEKFFDSSKGKFAVSIKEFKTYMEYERYLRLLAEGSTT